MLSCIFQLCVGPINTLTLEECSQTEPFRHLSNRVFRSQEHQKYLSSEAHI